MPIVNARLSVLIEALRDRIGPEAADDGGEGGEPADAANETAPAASAPDASAAGPPQSDGEARPALQ
jgi:hypothetical protein